MSTELERQISRLTDALDRRAPAVTEDELWHRRDAGGPGDAPVLLLDLHRAPTVVRRRWWAMAAVAGVVVAALAVGALAQQPSGPVSGNEPETTRPPMEQPTTTIAAPLNWAPEPNPDTASMSAGTTSLVIAVVANDVDRDGDALTVERAVLAPDSIGEAELSVLGDGSIRFAPADPCVVGVYPFTYTVSDAILGGPTSSATVLVNVVRDQEPPPTPSGDVFLAAVADLPFRIPISILLANDGPSGPCAEPGVEFSTLGADTIISVDDDAVVVDRAPGATDDVLSFAYTVENSHGVRASAAVTIQLS